MTLHQGEKKDTADAPMATSPGPSDTGGQSNGLESPTSPQSPTGSGSGARKQLPSIPDSDTQLSLANRMIDKKTSSPKGNHSYGPFFLEYSLLAEYNQLQKQKLPGVYVIPSARSPLLWLGVLFIRQGLYQEGVFRFSLHIPDNYPDGDCPRLVFEQPIFHPVIDPESGELDVKRAYQKWRRNVNHIWQVLLYARRVFYKIDTKNPLNPEAAVLYEQDLDVYKSRVTETVKKCKETLHDPPISDDPHAISFSTWDSDVHAEARSEILQPKEKSPSDGSKNAQTSGLSWMKAGTNQIFSEEDSASL